MPIYVVMSTCKAVVIKRVFADVRKAPQFCIVKLQKPNTFYNNEKDTEHHTR